METFSEVYSLPLKGTRSSRVDFCIVEDGMDRTIAFIHADEHFACVFILFRDIGNE